MIICGLTCFFLDLILEHITKARDLFNHLLFSSFIIFPNNFLFLCSAELIPKIFILADSKIKQCSWHLTWISGLKSYKKQIWLSMSGTIWNAFSLLCDTSWLVPLAFQVHSYYQEPSFVCDVFQSDNHHKSNVQIKSINQLLWSKNSFHSNQKIFLNGTFIISSHGNEEVRATCAGH